MEREIFLARGHPLITSLHRTTLEITKDREVTGRGDCIVSVDSSKGCSDLSEGVKRAIWERSEMYLLLELAGASEEIRGFGHEGLPLTHPTEMVFRKSGYLSSRTVLIHTNRSAGDLSRGFVKLLQRSDAVIRVTLGSV